MSKLKVGTAWDVRLTDSEIDACWPTSVVRREGNFEQYRLGEERREGMQRSYVARGSELGRRDKKKLVEDEATPPSKLSFFLRAPCGS